MADDLRTLRIERELAEADRHIAHGEGLIARQQALVNELQQDGHDTQAARDLLETMIESLRQMHAHRRLIEAGAAQITG